MVVAACSVCSTWVARLIPITPQFFGGRFIVRQGKRLVATPLFLFDCLRLVLLRQQRTIEFRSAVVTVNPLGLVLVSALFASDRRHYSFAPFDFVGAGFLVSVLLVSAGAVEAGASFFG